MTLRDNPHFQAAQTHLDRLLGCITPGDADAEVPVLPGVVDVEKGDVVTALMVPPPGIRVTDFNWCGNNLMHDVPLLESMLALARLTGQARYARAVDDMTGFYARRCPIPDTGLFPWGEHLQWSFADRFAMPCSFTDGMRHWLQMKYLCHDHLRFAPAWLWEKLWAASPEAVVRFAHGLDRHIIDRKTFEHNRHGAAGPTDWHDADNPDYGQGKDFARHAGFFIFDCLFAYRHSGDGSLLDWSERKLKWHLDRRLPGGIIAGCARSRTEKEEGQHDSLACSLADAADVLGRETAEGVRFAAWAEELFDARRRQAASRPLPLPDEPGDGRLWVQGYFRRCPIATISANLDHRVLQRTGIQWYADAIVETARWTAKHLPPPPPGMWIMARAFHHYLEIAIAGYLLTQDPQLLDLADRIAHWARQRLLRNGLFLGCSDMVIYRNKANCEYHVDAWAQTRNPGFYYSVSGTPLLVRTLLRLSLLQEKEEDILGIDPHRR